MYATNWEQREVVEGLLEVAAEENWRRGTVASPHLRILKQLHFSLDEVEAVGIAYPGESFTSVVRKALRQHLGLPPAVPGKKGPNPRVAMPVPESTLEALKQLNPDPQVALDWLVAQGAGRIRQS